MRTRTVIGVVILGLAMVATPVLASSPRVRVHLGWGWWYPGWWWGPTWAPQGPAHRGSGWTVVDTDVSPEQALVFLDGKLIGTADDFDGFPDFLYLRPPGRYELEFRLGGYQSATMAIDAAENHFVPVDLKLIRMKGERRAAWYDRPHNLPVARVFEKDRPAAERAETPSALSAVRADPARPDPSLRPDLTPDFEARPAAAGGVLVLVVKPDTAAVYLDGQFVGTAAELGRLERGLSVSSGRHLVEALAPGFAARSLTVEVEEGARQQVVIELDTAPGEGAGQNRTEVL